MSATRRDFLAAAAALGAAGRSPAAAPLPVIDTHTHFYDPTRPEGVPWPGKGDPVLYRPVMPPEYEKLAKPLGVTGTVVVEASPRVDDNRWLLDLAAAHPFLVGVVGRLLPADADFSANLGKFAKNPKFRGIRINGQEVAAAVETPAHRDRLAGLCDAGLTLEVNGGPEVLEAAAKLADALPKLPIVVNHLGNPLIDGKDPPAAWRDGLAAAAKRPNVWCKLSALPDCTRKRDRMAPTALAFYRPVFDAVWAAFGPDRLLFGSNWPVSDHYATFAGLFAITTGLMKPKGEAAARAVFGENVARAYGLKL